MGTSYNADDNILEGVRHSSPSVLRRTSSGGSAVSANATDTERLASEQMTKWNEFNVCQDFALQCYQSSNEAIHKLTTDPLAESANITFEDSISSAEGSGD